MRRPGRTSGSGAWTRWCASAPHGTPGRKGARTPWSSSCTGTASTPTQSCSPELQQKIVNIRNMKGKKAAISGINDCYLTVYGHNFFYLFIALYKVC